MRVPQSQCKKCSHITRHINRRKDPDQWRRHVEWQHRYHQSLTDEQRAVKRDQDRSRHRAVRSVSPDKYRSSKYTRGSAPRTILAAGPFVAWFEWVMKRDGLSLVDLAARFGSSDKTLRSVRTGERELTLEMVERALIADGTLTFDDLYPDAILEAA